MKHLTYAELGEKIAKKIGKFEIDLKSTEPDVRNTAERNMPKLKQAMESLKQSNEQEKVIAEAIETRNMMAKGGYMNRYADGGNVEAGSDTSKSCPTGYYWSTIKNKCVSKEELKNIYHDMGYTDRNSAGGVYKYHPAKLEEGYDGSDNIRGSIFNPTIRHPNITHNSRMNQAYSDYMKSDPGFMEQMGEGLYHIGSQGVGAIKSMFGLNDDSVGEAINKPKSKAYGGRINKYHSGGEIGHTHLDIPSMTVDMSGAGGLDQDFSSVQSSADKQFSGMDWMGLLENAQGLLGSLGKNKALNREVVPTEKYNAVYNQAEQQALNNLKQLERQSNAGYANSQLDTSLDTRGQRMANEANRLRAQKVANVGGPEGFAMQNAANNAANDRNMLIANQKANQEATLNSGAAKAAAGLPFTNQLGVLANSRMAIGKDRQFQDAYAQDAYRKDAAASRGINSQAEADRLENNQMQELMANQQGVDADTMQSLIAIFGDSAVQDMLGGLGGNNR